MTDVKTPWSTTMSRDRELTDDDDDDELASARAAYFVLCKIGAVEGWLPGDKRHDTSVSVQQTIFYRAALVCRRFADRSRHDMIRLTDGARLVLEIRLDDVAAYEIKTNCWHELRLSSPIEDDDIHCLDYCPRPTKPTPRQVIALYFSGGADRVRFDAMLEMSLRQLGLFDRLKSAGNFVEPQIMQVQVRRLKSIEKPDQRNADYEALRRTTGGRLAQTREPADRPTPPTPVARHHTSAENSTRPPAKPSICPKPRLSASENSYVHQETAAKEPWNSSLERPQRPPLIRPDAEGCESPVRSDRAPAPDRGATLPRLSPTRPAPKPNTPSTALRRTVCEFYDDLVGPWTCPKCTLNNPASQFCCVACDRQRDDVWLCPTNACRERRMNSVDLAVCPVCRAVRCRHCTWIEVRLSTSTGCSVCGLSNLRP